MQETCTPEQNPESNLKLNSRGWAQGVHRPLGWKEAISKAAGRRGGETGNKENRWQGGAV